MSSILFRISFIISKRKRNKCVEFKINYIKLGNFILFIVDEDNVKNNEGKYNEYSECVGF